MSAYSYYSQEYFSNAIGELERFLETYPSHERVSYAYYLLGICYYDQIVDEKRDLKVIEDAKKNFEKVIKDYPKSDFALDSEYKLELIEEILAAKEMHIGRFYLKKEKWIPAINRFKTVINEYDEHYVAKVLTGSVEHTDSVMAVHKGDCEVLTLGSYSSDGPVTMKI